MPRKYTQRHRTDQTEAFEFDIIRGWLTMTAKWEQHISARIGLGHIILLGHKAM